MANYGAIPRSLPTAFFSRGRPAVRCGALQCGYCCSSPKFPCLVPDLIWADHRYVAPAARLDSFYFLVHHLDRSLPACISLIDSSSQLSGSYARVLRPPSLTSSLHVVLLRVITHYTCPELPIPTAPLPLIRFSSFHDSQRTPTTRQNAIAIKLTPGRRQEETHTDQRRPFRTRNGRQPPIDLVPRCLGRGRRHHSSRDCAR